MIPKIVHQIWMQGWENLPGKFVENSELLEKLNPHWEQKKWNEKQLYQICCEVDATWGECFKNFKYMIQRVDFGRYVALYLYGGVSVDCDQKSIRSLELTPEFQSSNFIISTSIGGSVLHLFGSGFQTTLLYNNATIMCSPKNEILLQIIKDIVENPKSKFECVQSRTIIVTNSTGPVRISKILHKRDNSTMDSNKKFTKIDFKFLESEYPVEESILIHQHEASWLDPCSKVIAKFFYRHPNMIYLLIFLIVVLFIFLLVLYQILDQDIV